MPPDLRDTSGSSRVDTVSRIARTRIVALTAALAAVAVASAYGGWRAGRAGTDRVAVLERRVGTLRSNASALAAERDRLKADRDRLERQLAASDRPPAACPKATVSTLEANLLARYIVEYPCGWSVLEEPLQRPEQGSPRAGLVVDHLFLSAFPISKTPREGPLTEITLDGWYDDTSVEGDALPSFEDWTAEARTRFTDVDERSLRTRSGIAVLKLDGSMTAFDEPRPALLYLWEHTDTDGVRRIYEAFAFDPGREVRSAIEALVLSFRVPGG